MAGRNFHVHLVSDSTGETVSSVARACLVQYEGIFVQEHVWSLVRTKGQMEKVMVEVERNRGPVLYTLVDPELRDCVRDHCRKLQLPCVGVLDQVMSVLAVHFHSKSEQWPGRQHQLDEGYFDRIDAMHYTLAHDDGQSTHDLEDADVILVAALTGCRPEELRRGVLIRWVNNPRSGMGEIRFEIDGAKVKAHQGQPHRLIAYGAHDPHPLLEALRIRLAGRRELLVCIDSPVNFTVEVRRLARSLWPKHKHAITAYCLRHQWAADLKRHAAADSVSQGLGHASAKTRRHYGQANQASSRHALHPIAIEAERSVRPATAKAPHHRAASSKTVTP